MRLLGKPVLDKFIRRYTDARISIKAWRREVEDAEWETPADVKRRYANASFLRNNRVVFNIRGNNYRLDVRIEYKKHIVRIVRIGTHAEYDKWRF